MTRPLLFVLAILVACQWQTVSAAETAAFFDTGEEFVGPFSSWKNVKTDYGAKGDGLADDTAAIQRALDDLKDVARNDWSVLYFPAGQYRITRTLSTLRKQHNDYLGANLIGEDPATTVFLWDGPADKPILRYDAWYCKVSRLQFDGQKKATNGLVRAGGFSTYCELSDLTFKDIPGIALNLGNAEQFGAAEHAVLRCKFLRCGEGISTINWNTLDIYVWYCLFEDCGRGIYNRMGGYQAYQNVFLRSRQADLGSMNGMCFAVVNNTSIGSKTFLSGNAESTYLRGNRVFNTADAAAVDLTTDLVMLDNTFASRPGTTGSVVYLPGLGYLSAGNTFTVAHWPVRPKASPHPNAGTLQKDLHKAFDHDPKTELVDVGCNDAHNYPHPSVPFVLQWNAPAGRQRKVVKYTITAGSATKDAPRDFQLFGSQFPGHGWTLLDTQKGRTWNAGEKAAIVISRPGVFRVYRLAATANEADTPGMRVAEFELLDDAGTDLTQEPDCLMTGRNEAWGQVYQIEQRIVAPETLPTPATVPLPATPKNRSRKVFEVRRGTFDDAWELQVKILAAAREPAGSRPVVHLPKGSYRLKRTITVPALAEIQIVGDGVGNGTVLEFAGGPGPLLRLLGPSRVSFRDLEINGGNSSGVDAVVVEHADQNGGRIYGNQLNASGAGGNHLCAAAIYVDGLDRSDVTITCGGFGDCLNGLKVRGGAKAMTAGRPVNQVAFLTGASSHGCRLLDVSEGGHASGEAFWYEGDWDYPAALLDLSPTSSGNVSLAAAWWHMDSPTRPLVSIDGFRGTCAIVASSLDDRNGAYVHLNGDGKGASALLACSRFVSGGKIWPPEKAWVDRTSPPAQAIVLACNGASATNSAAGVLPDAPFALESLEQLRSTRIEPPMDRPHGATDLKFYRVKIGGGDGKYGIRIRAE